MEYAMGWLRCVATVLAVVLTIPHTVVAEPKPQESSTPLSADEIAIYKALLREYVSEKRTSLNLSSKTYPLDPQSQRNGLVKSECLKGIQLDNLAILSHTYHKLPSEVSLSGKVRLVDPEKQAKIVSENDPDKTIGNGKPVEGAVNNAFDTALFSMSEIAFDRDRRYAVVAYRFWCGFLCGHGQTLVFQKVGSEWKKSDRTCGGWVS